MYNARSYTLFSDVSNSVLILNFAELAKYENNITPSADSINVYRCMKITRDLLNRLNVFGL